ncbi:response regulator [Aerosakkonema sp. BLCC-F183]|uniref:response regulator n=1 Tax=Aerosakkonema sp. BLCC-F183 TaxID=3342834 RepID=UPI0035B7708E
MKIMVVDDEEDIQLLFKQKFRREIKEGKVQFDFALSAEAALDYLQKQGEAAVVLLLSDINMPGMNGLELLKIIKTNYKSLKVIMITAYGDENTYQKAMAYGANNYLNKPINFETLKRLIFGDV